MQAVMYVWGEGDAALMDFWWIKPAASDARLLEEQTLSRHATGPHKNDPGGSRTKQPQPQPNLNPRPKFQPELSDPGPKLSSNRNQN